MHIINTLKGVTLMLNEYCCLIFQTFFIVICLLFLINVNEHTIIMKQTNKLLNTGLLSATEDSPQKNNTFPLMQYLI